MCLSLFQIQNLCQFWSKSGISQKDTRTAFLLLFPSVLLLHMLASFKGKIGKVFCPVIFFHFRTVWAGAPETVWILWCKIIGTGLHEQNANAKMNSTPSSWLVNQSSVMLSPIPNSAPIVRNQGTHSCLHLIFECIQLW